jgi:CubicO group peptidase (beta-lactamase class C family)
VTQWLIEEEAPMQFTKNLLFNLITLCCVLNASNTLAQFGNRDVQQAISELQSRIPIIMEKADIPGLSIALIQDARIIWDNGFGVASRETNAPVTENMVFEVGSLTKPVFAYAALKLVEDGILDLDKPLSEYLEEEYIEDDRISQITARRVLSHTTGFPNWRPRGGELKIHFEPGEKFSYSGEGYVYLQTVVASLTEGPLHQAISRLVFEPLGMENSSVVWEDRFESQAAVGHPMSGEAVKPRKGKMVNAAASLRTTAVGYAKFVIAVLNETGLKKETFAEILRPHVWLDPNCVTCTNRQFGMVSKTLAWGLGWGLQSTDFGEYFWHWGDNGIFKCYIVADRQKRSGVVYMTNSNNGLAVRDEIVSRVMGGTHPAFKWVQYDQYDSRIMSFRQIVLKQGTEAGVQKFLDWKNSDGTAPVSERSINQLGYVLLGMKRVDEAIEIFKLNVREYAESFNVYDSLGEGYMVNGDTLLAIQYYEKSIEINPDNTNGIEMLKKLRGE